MLQQPIDCNCLTCTKLLPPPHFGIVLDAKQRYKALLVLKEPFNQKGCQCSSLISIGSFWDESRGASPGSEPCLDLGYQKAQIPFSFYAGLFTCSQAVSTQGCICNIAGSKGFNSCYEDYKSSWEAELLDKVPVAWGKSLKPSLGDSAADCY